MSRVFVAEEHRLDRRVVIKVLSPELATGVSSVTTGTGSGLAATVSVPVPTLFDGSVASARNTIDVTSFWTL